MRYFSMFSGIGGFELGIQRAYNNKSAYLSKEPKQEECSQRRFGDIEEPGALLCSGADTPLCVGFSEIDKYAIQTYLKHFPNHKNYGNAREINPDDLPDFNMLCGGFPCQTFSIAGNRLGFEDARGTLFFEIARIAKVRRPSILFLENVKGLLSHDNGRTFATILATLDELGYNAEWEVLNSKHYGVPQNRERVFIIGHLRGECTRQIFPLGADDRSSPQTIQTISGKVSAEANCLTSRYHKMAPTDTYIQYARKDKSQHSRVYELGGISPTLAGASKLSGDCTPKIMAVLTPNRENKRQNGRRFKEDGEEMFTLTNQDIHGVMLRDGRDNRSCLRSGRTTELGIKGQSIRRLTPIECERLQGFPDNWTLGSDTQRYKQCGNAVMVNVIQAIAEKLGTSL